MIAERTLRACQARAAAPRILRRSIGCLTLCLLAAVPEATAVWDTGNTAQPGQRTIYGRRVLGGGIGMPLAGGDFNGDGFADTIVTPMNASSGPAGDRDRSGEAAIVLGSGTIGGEIDLAAVDPASLPAHVTLIYGANALDYFGTETFSGDFDDDGFDDVLIGAQYGDGPGNTRANCGEVVLIWGSATIGGRLIDLAALQPGDPVTLIYGAKSGDRFGVWEGATDFDGDGITDLLIGADQGSGPANARSHAGESYVIYGSAALRSLTSIDLASPPVPVTIVYGIDNEDHSGCTLRGGDVDLDGVGDLLIGAGLNRSSSAAGPGGSPTGHAIAGGDGPTGTRSNAGEAYVVYGQLGVRPASIDLRAPPSSTVFIYGDDPGDSYGEELFIGNFNGDAYGDILIGALTADGPSNSRSNAGEVALILGSASLPGSIIDLATAPTNVTIFHGAGSQHIAGDTALFADVDGDGRDDLAIASPLASPGGRVQAGLVSVFFGTGGALPATVDLASPPPSFTPFLIEGNSDDDILAYSASSGDADADGFADLMLNVMGGDGFGDAISFAGDAYVISGQQLSIMAGRFTPTPGPSPTPGTSPGASLTPSLTPSRTATRTPTSTATRTATQTPGSTATRTPTRTPTSSASATPTRTPTRSASATPSATPTRSATASPAATPSYSIAGTIRYYRSAQPVPLVSVHLVGPLGSGDSTDGAGGYSFEMLGPDSWTVQPDKSGDFASAVSSLDAAHVLQAAVNKRTFSADQFLACDVTGNGTISSLDASRILQLAVNKLGRFPAGDACGSDWAFVPEPAAAPGQRVVPPQVGDGTCQPGAIAYEPLGAAAAAQDFRAVLFGDCTGNWQSGSGARVNGSVQVGRLRPLRNGRMRAMVRVQAAQACSALDLEIGFDPARLAVAGVHRTGAGRAGLVRFHVNGARLRIAFAAAEPIPPRVQRLLAIDVVPLDRGARRPRLRALLAALDEQPVTASSTAR